LENYDQEPSDSRGTGFGTSFSSQPREFGVNHVKSMLTDTSVDSSPQPKPEQQETYEQPQEQQKSQGKLHSGAFRQIKSSINLC
jgi:hypothetical protein